MTPRFRTLLSALLIILGSLFWALSQADSTQAVMRPQTERIGIAPALSPAPTPVGQKLVFLPLVTKTYRDLSWFIPDQLAGYPQPMTSSFGGAEPLDGLAVPGGYAGREWLDEPHQRFVLAMTMSWLTPRRQPSNWVCSSPRTRSRQP